MTGSSKRPNPEKDRIARARKKQEAKRRTQAAAHAQAEERASDWMRSPEYAGWRDRSLNTDSLRALLHARHAWRVRQRLEPTSTADEAHRNSSNSSAARDYWLTLALEIFNLSSPKPPSPRSDIEPLEWHMLRWGLAQERAQEIVAREVSLPDCPQSFLPNTEANAVYQAIHSSGTKWVVKGAEVTEYTVSRPKVIKDKDGALPFSSDANSPPVVRDHDRELPSA